MHRRRFAWLTTGRSASSVARVDKSTAVPKPNRRRHPSTRDALVHAVIGDPIGLPSPSDADLESFWATFADAAPSHLRFGFCVSTLVLGRVAPILFGHPLGLGRMDPNAADRLIRRAESNPLLSPLAEVAKVVACFAYFADEDVAARVRLTASQRIQRVEP